MSLYACALCAHICLMLSSLDPVVFKAKDVHHEKKEPEKPPEQPAYIPVVGESEPELKPAGQVESHKRKLDQSQLATDDFHYDKYRKRIKHF